MSVFRVSPYTAIVDIMSSSANGTASSLRSPPSNAVRSSDVARDNLVRRFDKSNSSKLPHPLIQPIQYNPILHSGERSNIGLPPSLSMSSASATITQPRAFRTLNNNSASLLSTETLHTARSPVPSTSATTDSKSSLLSKIFTDELFTSRRPTVSPRVSSPFTSPRVFGSPALQPQSLDDDTDLEQMARDDPLATQVWKMYARQKATFPHAQRMENITWRMMALALKKKKGEEEARQNSELTNENSDMPSESDVMPDQQSSDVTSEIKNDLGERGRRIDKGKAKVRVIGFDGLNQDIPEEDE